MWFKILVTMGQWLVFEVWFKALSWLVRGGAKAGAKKGAKFFVKRSAGSALKRVLGFAGIGAFSYAFYEAFARSKDSIVYVLYLILTIVLLLLLRDLFNHFKSKKPKPKN